MAEIIKKGKIKRKNGSNIEVLLPFTTEDQVENLVSDLAGKIADPATKAEGNFLRYDGSDWVAANIPDTGVLSVSAITDSGIKVDNTDAANPKVGIATTHKLPTITEWNGNIVTVNTEKSGKIEIGGVSKQVMPDNVVTDANYKHITVTSTSVSDGTTTFNKYDDTALAGRVSTIEGDYLKAADKTELQSAIDGKVAKTTKVNGKDFQLGDITIYGSDIEADSSTSTKLIGADHKVPLSLLPDAILGQLMYGGNVEKVGSNIIAYPTANLQAKLGITDTEIKLVNSATDDTTKTPKEYGYKTLQGAYFIARNAFDVTVGTETTSFQKGDWLIGAGTYWDKIDNTDAVTSVNGQTGAVVLSYTDVGAEAAFTDGSAKVADITSDVMSIYGVTQTGGAIGNGSKVGDVYTKGKVDTLLGGYVPTGRKVNGHTLTEDIAVTAGDIGLSVSATDGVTLGSTTYKYTHPTHTAAADGFYKVQVDALGHVIKTTAVAKADLTGLGVADDSLVAHLAGAETFTGKKSFTGDVELPVNVKVGDYTSTGLLKYTNGALSIDSNNYITENQTITVTGDATGSGKTSIALTLANSGVTAGTYSAVQVNSKGLVTSGGQMINVIAYGETPNVVDGGWYFEENQAA